MKTIVNVPTKQSLIRETRDYLMIALGLILYGIGWTAPPEECQVSPP